MIVIISHPDIELKLIKAQKRCIGQIFEINNQLLLYSAMPLWIGTEFESVQQAKEKISGITILAPEYDVKKESFVCPVEIQTDDGIIKSSLDFIHKAQGHCEEPGNEAIHIADEIFPLPVKIFRLGECNSSKPGVFELSHSKWVKLT